MMDNGEKAVQRQDDSCDCVDITEIKEEQVDSQGDQCSPVFIPPAINHVDCIRMRNSLTEILEELKLRRNNDVENEDRVRHLVQEKYEMERKLDATKAKLVSTAEEYDKKAVEIKRQFDDQIKTLQAEVRQNEVFKDCTQKETKALKDDIRNLQLTNYNLEKKLKEQGRKLQLQTSSTNQHLHQLSSAEEKFQSVSAFCKKLCNSQDRLARNVKEAVKLNRELMYNNEHQKCIINQHKGEITHLQNQLLDAKVKLDFRNEDTSSRKLEQELLDLKKQLENANHEHQSTVEELNKTTENYQDAVLKLQDSYKLIERHLQNAEEYKKETITLTTELGTCSDKLNQLQSAYDILSKDLATEKIVHADSMERWNKEEQEFKQEINTLTSEIETHMAAKAELEHLNTTWSENNLRLTEELAAAKAILDRPKENGEYQTTLSMLNTSENASQAMPELSTLATQTEQARHYHVPVQTDPRQCSDIGAQTYTPAQAVSATQTKEPPLMNRSAQTDDLNNGGKESTQTEKSDNGKMESTQTEDNSKRKSAKTVIVHEVPSHCDHISSVKEKTVVTNVESEQLRCSQDVINHSTGKENPQDSKSVKIQYQKLTEEKHMNDIIDKKTMLECHMEETVTLLTKTGSHDMIDTETDSVTHVYEQEGMSIETGLQGSNEIGMTSFDAQMKEMEGLETGTDSDVNNGTINHSPSITSKHYVSGTNYVDMEIQSKSIENSRPHSHTRAPYENIIKESDEVSKISGNSTGKKSFIHERPASKEKVCCTPTKGVFSLKPEFLNIYSSIRENTINTQKNYSPQKVKGQGLEQIRSRSVEEMKKNTNVGDHETAKAYSSERLDCDNTTRNNMHASRSSHLNNDSPKSHGASKTLSLQENNSPKSQGVCKKLSLQENNSPKSPSAPKKLSLYESHLAGYLSKISATSAQQNTVGLKLVKPRDNQDVPKHPKYVEYLQTSEKSTVDEDAKSKAVSPSRRGSLSLTKRRVGVDKGDIDTDFQEDRKDRCHTVSNPLPDMSPLFGPTRLHGGFRTSDQSPNLSPYSRYTALLKPKEDPVVKTKMKNEKVNSRKKRGILKEVVISSDRDRKSVSFSEDIVQVKMISPDHDMSGDQSLYSDEEEETIELISTQEDDCSEEKRPRLV